jgi:hypothetical protein
MKLAPQRKPLVAVSVRNLIAFSSYVDLTASKRGLKNADCVNSNVNPNSTATSGEPDIAGAHVYIADLNTPWESYL